MLGKEAKENKIYNEKLISGCIYSIHGIRVRAAKADNLSLNYCKGCVLNSLFTCPNIIGTNVHRPKVYCNENGIIFKKF